MHQQPDYTGRETVESYVHSIAADVALNNTDDLSSLTGEKERSADFYLLPKIIDGRKVIVDKLRELGISDYQLPAILDQLDKGIEELTDITAQHAREARLVPYYKERTTELEGTVNELRQGIAAKVLENTRLSERVQALESTIQRLNIRISGVLHDITNIVTTLKTRIDLLSMSENKDGDKLSIITRIASRLQQMIRPSWDFVTSHQRNYEIGTDWIDMTSFINDIILGFKDAHGQDVIEFVYTDLDTQIKSSRHYLFAILRNLIDNALKHGEPQDGKPKVGIFITKTENDSIVIRIRDNGRGIASEDQTKIFSLHETTSTGRSARRYHGVGLAMVRELVNTLGGDITVESKTTAVPNGSVFSLRLPAGSPETGPQEIKNDLEFKLRLLFRYKTVTDERQKKFRLQHWDQSRFPNVHVGELFNTLNNIAYCFDAKEFQWDEAFITMCSEYLDLMNKYMDIFDEGGSVAEEEIRTGHPEKRKELLNKGGESHKNYILWLYDEHRKNIRHPDDSQAIQTSSNIESVWAKTHNYNLPGLKAVSAYS